jgi:hypothetical protein
LLDIVKDSGNDCVNLVPIDTIFEDRTEEARGSLDCQRKARQILSRFP